jgi:hypothetical protein
VDMILKKDKNYVTGFDHFHSGLFTLLYDTGSQVLQ